MNTALKAEAPAIVVVRRTIAATAAELFDAWLDPQALAVWMRPTGIRRTTATTDARVGGRYEILMEGEQTMHPHHGVYQLIDRPHRLAFTWNSNATEGRETLVTVDFAPRGDLTEVVVTHERLPEGASASHTEGWTSALARLAEHGASETSP
jgi:uncharacterized protein YndB with AHSA1/START domain